MTSWLIFIALGLTVLALSSGDRQPIATLATDSTKTRLIVPEESDAQQVPGRGRPGVDPVGALWVSADNGGQKCTGAVVPGPPGVPALVLTAAHCLDEQAEAVSFTPGYPERSRDFAITEIFQPAGPGPDLAFLAVDQPGSLARWAGTLSVSFSGPDLDQIVARGYPEHWNGAYIGGQRQVSCRGQALSADDQQIKTSCRLDHGASGGPLVDPQGSIRGVLSHLLPETSGDLIYAQPLGAEARDLWSASAESRKIAGL